MTKTIDALFDGAVFKPVKPFMLKPNTLVQIIVEIDPPLSSSFLRTARSLNLDGPPDWSSNLENYLYGDKMDEK